MADETTTETGAEGAQGEGQEQQQTTDTSATGGAQDTGKAGADGGKVEAGTTAADGDGAKANGKAGGSIVSGDDEEGADDGGEKPAVGEWPDDWREKLAGGDDKFLRELKRYGSLKSWSDAGRAARQKISAGEVKSPLKEGATEAEVAAWRKENGIPETPDGYFEALPDGLVIGEDDKPLFQDFAAAMHAQNKSPSDVQDAMTWYYDMRERQMAEMVRLDEEADQNTVATFKEEWGPHYKENCNAIQNFLSTAPMDVRDAIKSARGPDGVVLTMNPGVIRFLLQSAERSGAAGDDPKGAGNGSVVVADEIAAIEKVMREDAEKYWGDTKMQDRLATLYAARVKEKSRAA